MTAELLTRLIEAGTPATLVAEVAMLAARADAAGEAIEKRRAVDRERQTRRRHATSRDITLDSVTARDVTNEPSPSPPPLLPPQTPPITPPPLPHPEGFNASTRKGRASGWGCPEGVEPKHWADVLVNRKSKRLANTATAYAGILRDLAKLSDDEWPPGRIIQHAAERGWGAIFDPRPKNGNRIGSGHHHHKRGSNGLLDAVFDAERDDRAGARY